MKMKGTTTIFVIAMLVACAVIAAACTKNVPPPGPRPALADDTTLGIGDDSDTQELDSIAADAADAELPEDEDFEDPDVDFGSVI